MHIDWRKAVRLVAAFSGDSLFFGDVTHGQEITHDRAGNELSNQQKREWAEASDHLVVTQDHEEEDAEVDKTEHASKSKDEGKAAVAEKAPAKS